MKGIGPRILLMGGNYRALCVLERLLDRGERVVAFIGEEGTGERDFCPEILEACDRAAIPARSGRKLGEEIVRWLEDRIRPDLAISVGLRTEVPLAIGGNCRLGMIEVVDTVVPGQECKVSLRQSGSEIASRPLPTAVEDDDSAGDLFLMLAECTLMLIDEHLDQVGDRHVRPVASIPYECNDVRVSVASGDDEQSHAGHPGPTTQEIERTLARYVGAERVVAVASAAEASSTLLQALELEPGSEILVPGILSHSFLGAIRECKLRPLFIDLEPRTLTMDPVRLEEALSDRTRAILVSHAFGQPADLRAIRALADSRRLPLIEDAASALGARVDSDRIGHAPSQCLFTLPFGSHSLDTRFAFLAVHGELGERVAAKSEKLRLRDDHARLALESFAELEEELSIRRENASAYSAELVRYDAFNVPLTPDGRLPTYAGYALRITTFARTCAEDLSRLLGECGIETRMIAPVGSDRELSDVPLSERIRCSTLLLPVGRHIDEEIRGQILDAIFDYAIG